MHKLLTAAAIVAALCTTPAYAQAPVPGPIYDKQTDLELSMQMVGGAMVKPGAPLQFTIVLRNTSDVGASGIGVRAGDEIIEAGTIDPHASVVLTYKCVARPGRHAIIAEIWQTVTPDIDSTAGNGNPTEDDYASVAYDAAYRTMLPLIQR